GSCAVPSSPSTVCRCAALCANVSGSTVCHAHWWLHISLWCKWLSRAYTTRIEHAHHWHTRQHTVELDDGTARLRSWRTLDSGSGEFWPTPQHRRLASGSTATV